MTRHDATNDATRDTTESDNVSFEEAARRLGVSLRTVQRRVRDGNLNTIESDGARLVCLTPTATSDATPRQIDATKRDSEPDANGEVLSLLKSENAFLRSMLEARERDAAELRSSLREALKAMPKALTAGNESASIEAATAPEHAQVNQTPAAQKQAAPRGTRARKLTAWQRAIMRMIKVKL
jgi:excisionase family DNA binding protein